MGPCPLSHYARNGVSAYPCYDLGYHSECVYGPFRLHGNRKGCSLRRVTALTGFFSLQSSLLSKSAPSATSTSGPTWPSSGVYTAGLWTRSTFKNGLWVQFTLAFNIKAWARLNKSLSVMPGTSPSASASASIATNTTVAP